MDQWSNPSLENRFDGPAITGLVMVLPVLPALSGNVSTTNPTAFNVSFRSNMLWWFNYQSNFVYFKPWIYGFSEVLSDTNLINTSNGRVQNLPVIDDESDDIYLYSISNNRHERLSKSSFGFPVNYLSEQQTNMPSNRFPSISGDGRHVYFSSDASGVGGLVFTNTNQEPDDDNDVRDVYHRDRKSTAVLSDDVDINMVYQQ